MAAPTVLTGGTQQGGAISGGDVTLTFPTLQEGDVVIVWGGYQDGATPDLLVIPSGYTEIYDSGGNTATPRFGVSYKRMGSTPDTNVVCPGNDNISHGVAYGCYCLRGVDPDTLLDADSPGYTLAGPTTSTNPDAPSIDTNTADALVLILALGVVAGTGDTAFTNPSGYTNQRVARGADTYDATVGGATKVVASPGTESPAAFTSWTSSTWRAITLAIKAEPPDPDAVTQVGSTLRLTAGSGASGTVSSTITVPDDADFVVVGVASHGPANYMSGGSMTFTKGGSDTAMVNYTGIGDDNPGSYFCAGFFCLVAPDTGTNKSLKWSWSDAADWNQLFSVTFWKNVDQSSPVRDSDGVGITAYPSSSVSLTAQDGDAVIVWVGFNGDADIVFSGLDVTENLASYDASIDGAWGFDQPTGNLSYTVESGGSDGATLAIVVVRKSVVDLTADALEVGSPEFGAIVFEQWPAELVATELVAGSPEFGAPTLTLNINHLAAEGVGSQAIFDIADSVIADYLGRTTANTKLAQTFTTGPTTTILQSIVLQLSKHGDPTDTLICDLYASIDDEPAGPVLASSSVIYPGTIPVYDSWDWFSFTFTSSSPMLEASSEYAIVVRRTGALSDTDYYDKYIINTDPYSGGLHVVEYGEGNWTPYSTEDGTGSLWTSVSTGMVIGSPVLGAPTLQENVVSFDNADGVQGDATSLTVTSYVCAGNLMIGIVGWSAGTMPTVTSIIWNGQAPDGTIWDKLHTGSNYRTTAYYWLDAAATANLVVNFSGNADECGLVACSFNNADLNDPFGTPVTGQGESTTASVNVSSAAGEIVLDGTFTHVSDNITVGADQTERYLAASELPAICVSTEPGAGTVTMSWALGGTKTWVQGSVAIKPVSVGGGDNLTATGLTTGSPVLDAPVIGQEHAHIATALTVAGPALDAGALTTEYSFTADALTVGDLVIGAPALALTHALTADALVTGAPIIDAATLTTEYAFVADALTTTAPEISTADLATTYDFVVDALTVSAPVIGTSTIGQTHALAADAPTVTSPVFGEPILVATSVLASDALTVEAPAFGAIGLEQVHALAADALTTSALDIGTASMAGETSLAADGLTVTAPDLGAPDLGYDYTFVANALTVTAPVFGEPTVAITSTLEAVAFVSASPEIGTPDLGQVHAFTAVALQVGAPVLGEPTVIETNVLVATGLPVGSPQIGEPVFLQANLLEAVPFTTGPPVLDLEDLDETNLLTATALQVGAVVLGEPAFNQIASLAALPFDGGALDLGAPSLQQWHSLVASSLQASALTLGTPAFTQSNVLTSTALQVSSPQLAEAVLVQDHALVADAMAASAPVFGTPALIELNDLILDGYVLDNGLVALSNEADELWLCSRHPTDYADALTVKLASKSFGVGGVFGDPADGDPNGRIVVSGSVANGNVAADGMALVWAAVDTQNTRLLATGSLATPLTTSTLYAWSMDAFNVHVPVGQ